MAELERRLSRIEDERAIERMIASYGPLVDAGVAEATGDLWAAEGSYDVEGWPMRSRADVVAMVGSDAHQGLITRGCCHFLGPSVVTVDGDSAVAVCESILVRNRDGVFLAAAFVQVLEHGNRLGRCHVVVESFLDNRPGFCGRVLRTKQRFGRKF